MWQKSFGRKFLRGLENKTSHGWRRQLVVWLDARAGALIHPSAVSTGWRARSRLALQKLVQCRTDWNVLPVIVQSSATVRWRPIRLVVPRHSDVPCLQVHHSTG